MKRSSISSKPAAEWWRGGVIYQVYPRSFQDTTGNGVGDLKGVTKRLGHIASLGVDAIWLSPFFKSPQADMGYDVSDYCAVDPLFGALDDFDTMVEEAHRLGLKVVIDQVISHTSDQHPWFEESRASRDNTKADWYVWADPKPDGTAPNNWLSIFGGPAWEWDGVRMQYYMHNFLACQPDLNFHNEEVQDALLESVKFWLERGVDGFRLDTVNFYFHDRHLRNNPPLYQDSDTTSSDAPDVNPYGMQEHLYDKTRPENLEFLGRFRGLLDQYEGRAAVGEVGDGARSLKTVAEYTGGGDKLHMCYTFDLLGPDFSADHIRRCIENFETEVQDGWVCWAFSNHDVVRHVSRFISDVTEREPVGKLAISVLCALRGSICLYQGEELGLREADIAFEDLQDPYGIRFWPAFKGRDGCRTPMPWVRELPFGGFTEASKPWLPMPGEHRTMAVDVQNEDSHSVLSHYRAMLGFRRRHAAMMTGDITLLEKDSDVLAFLREAQGERLIFAFNLSRAPARFNLPAEFMAAKGIDLPGFSARADNGVVSLDALDAFCGSL